MALTLLPPKGQGQIMAACMLLIALALVYYFGMHWFVRGHLDVAHEIDELKLSELRFRQELQKKAPLEKRLVAIKQFQASNDYFLSENSFDLAAAGLSTKIKDVVNANANTQRCSVLVRLKCDLDDLVKIIYALENATPLLFVDELNLYQQPMLDASLVTAQGGNMDARFDISGYIRVANTPKDAEAKP
jgi:general secretion pathway protein M